MVHVNGERVHAKVPRAPTQRATNSSRPLALRVSSLRCASRAGADALRPRCYSLTAANPQLGRKNSLRELLAKLRQAGIVNVRTTEFFQVRDLVPQTGSCCKPILLRRNLLFDN
jgi:hypothetical protein|eukprot:COSAG06_NODE_3358_length_5458_cov_7.822542_4_plen_114_part_00